jgi:hypothetical protein
MHALSADSWRALSKAGVVIPADPKKRRLNCGGPSASAFYKRHGKRLRKLGRRGRNVEGQAAAAFDKAERALPDPRTQAEPSGTLPISPLSGIS